MNPADSVPWIVAGLGNPGTRYEATWHNAGFLALEVLSQRTGIRTDRIRFQGLSGQGTLGGNRVVLLKPSTFMNRSGQSIRDALAWHKVPPERLVVVYDDIDLPCGTLRIRPSGGPGTHNGMRSIVETLGTESFPRVRIGIGPVPERWDLADYVLSPIPGDRREILFQSLVRAAQAVETLVVEGLAAAMNKYNGEVP